MKQLNKQKHIAPRFGDTGGLTEGTEFPVMVSHKVSNQYSIFLDNTLESPQEMRHAIQTFLVAQEQDNIFVFLNSPGGSVSSGQAFLNAMQQAEAPVTVIGSGDICSMGAIILSAAESFQLDPFASVMYHPCTSGYSGNFADIIGYAEFSKSRTELLLNYYTIGILTAAELQSIHEQKREIWLNTEEFTDRFIRKMQCQELLVEYLEDNDIPSSEVTPADYVEYMKIMLEQYEASKQKESVKKPARKRKPVVKAES